MKRFSLREVTRSKVFGLMPMASLLFCFFVVACGQQSGTTFEYEQAPNTSQTTFALGITPKDLTGNVALNSVIKVSFSDQIDPRSVDNFTFRIENENNQPIDGEITISDDYKELSFVRRVAGVAANWEPSTTYSVYTRYLKDQDGNYIPSKSSEFSTQLIEAGQSGAFTVENVLPTQESFTDYLLNVRPDTPLTLNFSLPIAPNLEVCDTPVLRTAIQIVNVDIGDKNNSLSVPPMDAQICLRCPARGYCNRIEVRPRTPFRDNSLLLIMARPTDGFYGIQSDGNYDALSSFFVKERFVFFRYWFP